MATGIRIQHATERNVTFTLVDGSRLLAAPMECGACHRFHVHKTYHLVLDESGAAIVSQEIWQRLQRIPGNPFSLANAVKEPPVQRLAIASPLALLVRAKPPGGVDAH